MRTPIRLDGRRRVAWPAALPWSGVPILVVGLVAGCGGPMSTLEPAGREAERIAQLFTWMSGGAVVVWLLVIGLAIYAVRRPPGPQDRRSAVLVLGGGIVLPTLVLTGLLTYGLWSLPRVLEPAPEGSLRIDVTGEQWWWRVRYVPAAGEPVELANEIHLPLGERVEFRLASPDVIHAFWIPSLAGKVDMIPGRQTRLALEATRPGVYRGACAEYCGASHAFMNFMVVVEPREAFEAWLATQRRPAAEPAGDLSARGREAFLEHGCGACHTVRGSPADGVIGPDLTHVGGRRTLAAAMLPNGTDALRRWISFSTFVKPDVHMPAFGMLPPDEVAALAAWLESLE